MCGPGNHHRSNEGDNTDWSRWMERWIDKWQQLAERTDKGKFLNGKAVGKAERVCMIFSGQIDI